MRHGPDKVVFSSIEALHGRRKHHNVSLELALLTAVLDIYQNEGLSKSRCYQDGNMNPKTENVFNVIDKRAHRIKRQLVGKLVTERSMRNFEPIMMEQVHIFLRQLLPAGTNGQSSAVNISERCKFFGMDVAALLAFGYRLKLQTDEKNRYILPAMVRGGWVINMYMQYSLLRRMRLGLLLALPRLMSGKGFLDVLRKMINSRLTEEKHARHDLYSHMADALDASGDDRITMNELWGEAIFFLPAAGDTSSTALASVFFYLARNQSCRQKLTEEIRSRFATSDEIRGGPKLASCEYLRACINESMRMSPPVGGTLWREQSRDQAGSQLVVDGHVIPAGTQVGVNIYALHHNPDYFPDSFTYNPERWISSTDKPEVKSSIADAFMAFSVGSRGCAGKPMAYQEVSLTIAMTLWYFDFEEVEEPGVTSLVGSNESSTRGKQFKMTDIFTSDHDGPWLKFRPRAELWKELVAEEQ